MLWHDEAARARRAGRVEQVARALGAHAGWSARRRPCLRKSSRSGSEVSSWTTTSGRASRDRRGAARRASNDVDHGRAARRPRGSPRALLRARHAGDLVAGGDQLRDERAPDRAARARRRRPSPGRLPLARAASSRAARSVSSERHEVRGPEPATGPSRRCRSGGSASGARTGPARARAPAPASARAAPTTSATAPSAR